MSVQHVHTYLVHPGKSSRTAASIGGAPLELSGKLFGLLNDIYTRSESECDIDISFNHTDGKQTNPFRDLVLDYLQDPSLLRGRNIAERLEKVTTHRSGLGLLFLISGREGSVHKIVISRFPTDSAVLAEENKSSLSVEYLERVFMKSATSYKAALFQDSSFKGFWTGKAVDKQINNQVLKLSTYWISDFLASDFRTTAAAGTRRLAIALRDAARNAPHAAVKTEIAAAVTLARGLQKRRLTIREFQDHFGLSELAKQIVEAQVKIPKLVDERFQFDFEEFRKHVAYRSVELDSGGILSAQSDLFDRIFQRQVVDYDDNIVRYSTQGKIVNEKLTGKLRP